MPPVWVNPDPPSYAPLIGKCARADGESVTHVMTELGTFATNADCQARCENNPKKCTAFQFTESTQICKTFTGAVDYVGNEVAGSQCTIKEKDLV